MDRARRWIRILALSGMSIAAFACSKGGGGGGRAGGGLHFTYFSTPTAATSGHEARVSFGIVSHAARKRVAVTLELIPRNPDVTDLESLAPEDPR